MLGRLLILIAMMLFGPLFIEVYLYHPMIAIEHDKAALVPFVASPLALFAGFLLLAADNRATTALFALVCMIEIMVGVVGTAIHVTLHYPDFATSALRPIATVWLGDPPILVPLSFAAAGCLGLIPIALPVNVNWTNRRSRSRRILEALARPAV